MQISNCFYQLVTYFEYVLCRSEFMTVEIVVKTSAKYKKKA